MIKRRHPPLEEVWKSLDAALLDLRQIEEALIGKPRPKTPEEDEQSIGVLLHDLQGVRQRLQKTMQTIASYQRGSPRQERRGSLFRKFPHITIPTNRTGVSADEMQVAAALAKERMRMAAELHNEAAEIVGQTLERSHRREQEAARNNPEISPFLSAYFDASRRTLLQNTADVLHTSFLDLQPPDDEEKPSHGPA